MFLDESVEDSKKRIKERRGHSNMNSSTSGRRYCIDQLTREADSVCTSLQGWIVYCIYILQHIQHNAWKTLVRELHDLLVRWHAAREPSKSNWQCCKPRDAGSRNIPQDHLVGQGFDSQWASCHNRLNRHGECMNASLGVDGWICADITLQTYF